jgi:hypothetical protein
LSNGGSLWVEKLTSFWACFRENFWSSAERRMYESGPHQIRLVTHGCIQFLDLKLELFYWYYFK